MAQKIMIDILLSTYNGEKFIQKQLNSIINQTYTNWNLIIRDDKSNDNTTSIINTYIEKYPQKISLINGNSNLGVIKSFECLLSYSNNKYIMFCDQDDIWMPNKIEISLKTIQQLENQHSQSTPILIHSDLTLIDINDNITYSSFWKYANIQPNILNHNPKFLAISNSVTGCTIMMNKAVKDLVLPFPQKVYMHDAYIAMQVCLKGILHPIHQPLMYYRQHNFNTIGAIKYDYNVIHKIQHLSKTINKALEMYSYNPHLYKNIIDFWITKYKYFKLIHKQK